MTRFLSWTLLENGSENSAQTDFLTILIRLIALQFWLRYELTLTPRHKDDVSKPERRVAIRRDIYIPLLYYVPKVFAH